MAGGRVVTYTCTEAFSLGTHKGPNASAFLRDIGANFKTYSVRVGMPVYRLRDNVPISNGLITAVTDDTITDDTNTWDDGDQYEIYIQTKGTTISTMMTDVSRGWKADPKELDRGWFPEDVPLDRENPHVFGPDQPEPTGNIS